MTALAGLTHPLDEHDPTPIPELPDEPPFTVTVIPDGASVVLQLDGQLDLATVGTFRTCLEHLDPSVRTVVVDTAGLSFIDSTGVGAFVRARRDFEVALRTLVVRNPSERVRFTFELTGLTDLLG